MGNNISTETGNQPSRTIIIDEWEIPEAYKSVAVSDEVVQAVSASVPKVSSPTKLVVTPDPHLIEELEKQKSLNNQLKEELENMSNIQKRPQISWNAESREEMNEKKKAFDESIQRVRQQYFNQQKENVCSDIENKILHCLASNKKTILNCHPLQFEFQQCVDEHKQRVLQEKTKEE